MLVGKAAYLTGYGIEEAGTLPYIPKTLAWISAGTAIRRDFHRRPRRGGMDVSMSVSSAVEEVKKANPALGMADRFRSGLN